MTHGERKALKLALEALETPRPFDSYPPLWRAYEETINKAITAIKEALAQEKALQALHDENERLGLYKDAYAQPEIESVRLQCVTCGTVYADGVPPQVAQPAVALEQDADRFCDANCTWSDHHPDCKYGKPEQRSNEHLEPVAWAMLHDNGDFIDAINSEEHARIEGDYKHALYTTQPPVGFAVMQKPWVGLTEQEQGAIMEDLNAYGTNLYQFARAIEAKLKAKNERLETNT